MRVKVAICIRQLPDWLGRILLGLAISLLTRQRLRAHSIDSILIDIWQKSSGMELIITDSQSLWDNIRKSQALSSKSSSPPTSPPSPASKDGISPWRVN